MSHQIGSAPAAYCAAYSADGTIVVGLSAALEREPDAEMLALGRLLSAAFERAALDFTAGADSLLYRNELKRMLAEAFARG